jgi:two-component system sensor histidine kinase YesM
MKMVEDCQLDINVDIKGEEEVVKLAQTFNMMLMRIRKLLAQVLQEQEEKRKSELDALQAQINPHFLYNTLDSIVWMAENEKNEDVITMVTSLARFFRISISRGKNVITIEEELEHARNYMIIQKMRYKNKFRFEIEAEKDTLHCKTLKLILQPLIENALYHGIEYMVDEGYINISVRKLDGKILFQVKDNGLGMPPEKLETLLLAKSKEYSGVGVKNVHERIKLFYGNEYGLEIESQLEVGTNVKIWIPIIEDYNGGTLI